MKEKPNILLVSIDSLRADACSFLDAKDTTPNMARLAERSAVFTKAISPSGWTLPVHTSVFTGLYPTEHQILDSGMEVGDHPTLGEKLRDFGYETVSFGRNSWLQQGGMLRGYDHTTSPRPMAESEGVTGKIDLYSRWARRLFFRHHSVDDITVRNAIRSIENRNEPYCCFVHLNGVHYIYNPPSPYHRQFSNRSLPSLVYNLYQQKQLFIEHGGVYPGRKPASENFISTLQDLYQGCVRYSDSLVKRLVTAAESSERDTVIIIFGDHGDSFGDNNVFGHQYSVADSIVRVPLLIYDPTDRLPSKQIDDVVQLNDIYPTLFGILDERAPPQQSRDLAEDTSHNMALVYTKPPQAHADKVTSHTPPAELPPETQVLGWKNPDEKVVWYPDEEPDIEQMNGRLYKQLENKLDSLKPVSTIAGGELSQSTKQNLKELGYM